MEVSNRTAQAQREIALFLYEKTGPSAVYDYGNKVNAPYGYCKGCEADTPTIKTAQLSECMLCGQETKEWSVTDPDCNQEMIKLSDNKFMFREDRILNPETKETHVYESEIDLANYSQDQMFDAVEPFGYSFNEMATWIDEGENLDIIAECIFEMET